MRLEPLEMVSVTPESMVIVLPTNLVVPVVPGLKDWDPVNVRLCVPADTVIVPELPPENEIIPDTPPREKSEALLIRILPLL